MKPILSDKNTVFLQINIEKNNRIISDDFDLSEEFSTFFEDAVRSLNVKLDEYYLSYTENLSHPLRLLLDMTFGKQKFDFKQLKRNKFIFDVKQLKINKFIKSIWQLIISTSNATLYVPSLHPWRDYEFDNFINILALQPTLPFYTENPFEKKN